MKFKNIIFFIFLSVGFFSCGEDENNEIQYNNEGVAINDNDSKEIDNPVESANIQQALNQKTYPLSRTAEVQEFYKQRRFEPIWKPTELRASFLKALRNTINDGLDYEDYHGKRVDQLLENSSLTKAEGAELDLLLTDAYFELSDHLLHGKVNPEELHNSWGIAKDTLDRKKIFAEAIQNENIAEAVVNLKPNNKTYIGLRKSLMEYRKRDREITEIEAGGVIKPGEKDGRIPSIARRFKELDLLPADYQIQDNVYDKTLQKTVKELQKNQGLVIDGVIGPTTFKFLNKDNEERRKQIALNLERWRWYPQDLSDHYILVNIADYKVSVVRNGDTISTRKAVVGKRGWETPLFTDTLSYVVFNPTWTIPQNILEEDIAPQAINNPSYLRRNNIAVYDREGNTINPAGVDWDNYNNYIFEQRAGPGNPLGNVKLIYPNKYFVYLHDTPAKQRFDQNVRAVSHGCVRVQNAVGLAEYVLQDQEKWDSEKVKEVIASGETTQVPVEQQILVHHLYYTAWRKNNETHFTKDVYGFDEKLLKALEKT